ncbi:hypothetical protein FKR81_22285 [Lentzea tibetensis]|uniref:Uncharacterized protein n=1 Tax=Lentzea tibetensis TaxID=2591470 RepID=A0A563EQP9_9PSEU|nr:M12 family metallo-peptidase [Lentzea tibetensis]TWP49963.1 hypothetical protein FKR81_22285 [Lentzea tibetensis]
MTRILLAALAMLVAAAPTASADELPVVDVLVLYTPKALHGAGGVEQLKAIAQKNADYTNGAFINSYAEVRTRIVAVEPAPDYNPSGKEESPAAYDYTVRTPASAAAVRDRVRADVVHVMAAEVGGFSNSQRRPVPTTSEGPGKKVLVGFDRPETFFAHELGHLLGLDHDEHLGPGRGDGYDYVRGYVAPSLKWRTIMAYETQCKDAGTTCPDVQYFSNPSLTYEGERLGVPKGELHEADEVSMLNESAPIVAAYR